MKLQCRMMMRHIFVALLLSGALAFQHPRALTMSAARPSRGAARARAARLVLPSTVSTPPRAAAGDADGDAGTAAGERRALDRQFVAIALPALAQFAAEPLAGLVDTAYMGRLGAAALGGAGVAISAHYTAAKLFNDPLLRSSISLVAAGDGATRAAEEEGGGGESAAAAARDDAIAAALVLAAAVGLGQMLFFIVAAGPMCSVMGAPAGSAMRPTALSYLRARSLGLPAATLWRVARTARAEDSPEKLP